MKIHNVIPGSAEWLQLRKGKRTASEAPAMMGASKYQTRTALLHQKHTGMSPDVDGYTQKLFDRGHETEAEARAIVEAMIDDDLYPVTCTDDAEYLLASLDGRVMSGEILFEHKLLSESLLAQVRAKELEPHYYWQLEQQLLVTGAEKVIFVCSDGTESNFEQMEYRAVPGRAEQLLAGWKQFDADLAAYTPAEAVAPAPVAAPIDALPALFVRLVGSVTESNLVPWKEVIQTRIAGISTDLTTDQHFADAEGIVKFLDGARGRLKEVKAAALAQTVTIEELFNDIDAIDALMQQKMSALEKTIKARKDAIRLEELQKGVHALAEHMKEINARFSAPYVPTPAADFAGAMKGKRLIETLREAVGNTLVAAKTKANIDAEQVGFNLVTLNEIAGEYPALFPDLPSIILKKSDDFLATVKTRVLEQKAREAAKKLADDKAAEDAKAAATAKATEVISQAQAPSPAPVGEAVITRVSAPVRHASAPAQAQDIEYTTVATPTGAITPMRAKVLALIAALDNSELPYVHDFIANKEWMNSPSFN